MGGGGGGGCRKERTKNGAGDSMSVCFVTAVYGCKLFLLAVSSICFVFITVL